MPTFTPISLPPFYILLVAVTKVVPAYDYSDFKKDYSDYIVDK